MKHKLRLIWAGASCGLVALAAFASATSNAGAQKGLLIGNSVPQGADPVLTAQRIALETESKRRGNRVISADAKLDLNKQIADVDSFVQRGVDVLVIWPLDPNAIQPALDRARDEGIKIIVRQTTIGGPYFTNFQEDDERAGSDVAAFLARKLGKGAKVAAILGPQQIEVFAQRNRGFLNGAKRYGLDVVDKQTNSRITPEASATFARTWKQRFGASLEGIFDVVDATALAAAAQRSGSFQPAVVGIGGSELAIAGVRKGQLTASWDMQAIVTGRAEAWAADLAGRGKTLPRTIHLPIKRVDKTNVAKWVPFKTQLAQPMTFSTAKVGGQWFLRVKTG